MRNYEEFLTRKKSGPVQANPLGIDHTSDKDSRCPPPVISICIPTYNHAKFLPETLESILTQSYQDFEIVLVDDGSTDKSLQIAREFEKNHPNKIKVFTHPNNKNLGISATQNLAINLSSGEYWSAFASDDILLPGALESLTSYLKSNPDCDMVYGYSKVLTPDGKTGRLRGIDISNSQNVMVEMILYNPIPPGVTAKRSANPLSGLYDDNLIYSDWEFWVRFLSRKRPGFINKQLALYRHHENNTSIGISKEKNNQYIMEVMQTLERKASDVGGLLDTPLVQGVLNLQLSFLFYEKNDLPKTKEHIEKAYDLYPFPKNNLYPLALFLKNKPLKYTTMLLGHCRIRMEGKRGWEVNPHLIWMRGRNFLRRVTVRWGTLYRLLAKLSDFLIQIRK